MSRSTTKAVRERLQRFDAAKLVDVRVCVGATGRSTKRVTVLYTSGKREPMALSRLVTFEQRARRLANSGLKWPVRTQQSLVALVAEARLRIQTDPDVSLRAERGRKRALARDAARALNSAKDAVAKAMPIALRADVGRDEVVAAIDVGRVYDEAIVQAVHDF